MCDAIRKGGTSTPYTLALTTIGHAIRAVHAADHEVTDLERAERRLYELRYAVQGGDYRSGALLKTARLQGEESPPGSVTLEDVERRAVQLGIN